MCLGCSVAAPSVLLPPVHRHTCIATCIAACAPTPLATGLCVLSAPHSHAALHPPCAHRTVPSLHPCAPPQHPSAASNAKGPYLPKELTEHRPTLQSEYSKLVLEQALDAALEEARRGKEPAAAKA